MQSWIFSIITSVSNDPSEIILLCWFAAQETFLIIINVKNSSAASYFFKIMIHFNFKLLYSIIWKIIILKHYKCFFTWSIYYLSHASNNKLVCIITLFSLNHISTWPVSNRNFLATIVVMSSAWTFFHQKCKNLVFAPTALILSFNYISGN